MDIELIIALLVVVVVVVMLVQQRSFIRRASVPPESAAQDSDELMGPITELRHELARSAERLDERERALSTREEQIRVLLEQLNDRERSVSSLEASVDERARELKDERRRVERERAEAERLNQEASEKQERAIQQLESIAHMTKAEAMEQIIERAEADAKARAHIRAVEIEEDATRDARQRASRIVATAIERVAAQVTAESTVKVVDVPSEEMKGRIIGKDGRNIRALEQLTGVTIVVDDTPGAIMLSSFDPVRREVARVTLTDLIRDSRINPSTIEDAYERAEVSVREQCLASAEDAVVRAGIGDISEELLDYVGALSLRTSYGQNVLEHSVECAQLAASMAAEIGADTDSCRRAAFLHDIGKSVVTHGEASHALEGAELARRHGEPEIVVHAIAAHHNEIPAESVEDVLTQAADTISSSRLGARRESSEEMVKRMAKMEKIASRHSAVDKVFALQAGREVRVLVKPEKASDADTHELARQIADQIAEDVVYPGRVKVTVIRESRATEMA